MPCMLADEINHLKFYLRSKLARARGGMEIDISRGLSLEDLVKELWEVNIGIGFKVMQFDDSLFKITGSDPNIVPSYKDKVILFSRYSEWSLIEGPRVGDYVEFTDGVIERFSHDWDEDIQSSEAGSYYLGEGYVSMSGGLNTSIRKELLVKTGRTVMGDVWFFHEGHARAHSGVYAEIQCQVYAAACGSSYEERKKANDVVCLTLEKERGGDEEKRS